jgi:hypothetical protein
LFPSSLQSERQIFFACQPWRRQKLARIVEPEVLVPGFQSTSDSTVVAQVPRGELARRLSAEQQMNAIPK